MLISSIRSTNSIPTVLLVGLFWLLNIGLGVWELEELINKETFPWLEFSVSMLSVLGISIHLNYTVQKHKFVSLGDGIVGIVFLISMLGLPNSYIYSKEFFALLLITISNERLISLHNAPKNYLRVFELGLLLGVGILVSPNLIMTLLNLVIGIALVISFSWRDFIIPIIGVLFVFFIAISYSFLVDGVINDDLLTFSFSYPEFNAKFNLSQVLITLISLFEFLILVTLFGVIEKRSIKERVYYWLWIWTAVFMFVSLLFFQDKFNKVLLIVLLGLPCSVFAMEYFKSNGQKKSDWKKEVILILFLLVQLLFRVVENLFV